jgi:hypothetical protein
MEMTKSKIQTESIIRKLRRQGIPVPVELIDLASKERRNTERHRSAQRRKDNKTRRIQRREQAIAFYSDALEAARDAASSLTDNVLIHRFLFAKIQAFKRGRTK